MICACIKQVICFYHTKRASYPVSEGEFAATEESLCNADYKQCAIYKVVDKVGFLKCPADLRPKDQARVFELTK